MAVNLQFNAQQWLSTLKEYDRKCMDAIVYYDEPVDSITISDPQGNAMQLIAILKLTKTHLTSYRGKEVSDILSSVLDFLAKRVDNTEASLRKIDKLRDRIIQALTQEKVKNNPHKADEVKYETLVKKLDGQLRLFQSCLQNMKDPEIISYFEDALLSYQSHFATLQSSPVQITWVIENLAEHVQSCLDVLLKPPEEMRRLLTQSALLQISELTSRCERRITQLGSSFKIYNIHAYLPQEGKILQFMHECQRRLELLKPAPSIQEPLVNFLALRSLEKDLEAVERKLDLGGAVCMSCKEMGSTPLEVKVKASLIHLVESLFNNVISPEVFIVQKNNFFSELGEEKSEAFVSSKIFTSNQAVAAKQKLFSLINIQDKQPKTWYEIQTFYKKWLLTCFPDKLQGQEEKEASTRLFQEAQPLYKLLEEYFKYSKETTI